MEKTSAQLQGRGKQARCFSFISIKFSIQYRVGFALRTACFGWRFGCGEI
jgi:hypothetical protein